MANAGARILVNGWKLNDYNDLQECILNRNNVQNILWGEEDAFSFRINGNPAQNQRPPAYKPRQELGNLYQPRVVNFETGAPVPLVDVEIQHSHKIKLGDLRFLLRIPTLPLLAENQLVEALMLLKTNIAVTSATVLVHYEWASQLDVLNDLTRICSVNVNNGQIFDLQVIKNALHIPATSVTIGRALMTICTLCRQCHCTRC